jgi:hypothetical protein
MRDYVTGTVLFFADAGCHRGDASIIRQEFRYITNTTDGCERDCSQPFCFLWERFRHEYVSSIRYAALYDHLVRTDALVDVICRMETQ